MIKQNAFSMFKDKTVFVTGHTGFIGSWLTLWLHELGAKIVGYSSGIPTNPSMFETIESSKYVTHITGDVRDFSHLQDCISKYEPYFVFHLAAQPIVRASYEKPSETFETNVMGTVNLLESIRNSETVKVCIIMTSDKCYQNQESTYAYKETDPMGGHDPYSASKGAAELVTSSYRNSFFDSNKNTQSTSIATIRAGNVIGGGDWADDRIVPDSIRALIAQRPIQVRNPNSIRPWQHVLEPISGMLCLAKKMLENPSKFSEPWNFGPLIQNKVSVRDIVSQIIKEWGSGEWHDISKEISNPLHEAGLLMLDSTKAINHLGWHPTYSIQESISETIRWYYAYEKNDKDMNKFSSSQIENFIIKAKQMNIEWAKDST